MPALLCINTVSAVTAVSLQPEGDPPPALITRTAVAERSATQYVLPLIDGLLKETGSTIGDLDGIGIMAGPGSFTGIRIGLSVAQGLAYPHALPLIPLSSLAVQAAHAHHAWGLIGNDSDKAWVVVCMQARQREIYAAIYRATEGGGVGLVGQEQVCEPDGFHLETSACPPPASLLCSDCPQLAEELCIHLGLRPAASVKMESNPLQSMTALAALAYDQGRTCTAAELRPNYVKDQLDYNRTVQAHDS